MRKRPSVCAFMGDPTGDTIPSGSAAPQKVYACAAIENTQGKCVPLHPRDLCGKAPPTSLPVCDGCRWRSEQERSPRPQPIVPLAAEKPKSAPLDLWAARAERKFARNQKEIERLQTPEESPWVAPAHPIEWFDRVVVVSLKRRGDRRESFFRRLHEARWPFYWPDVFMAVDGRAVPSPHDWNTGAGAWGCMQSHRQVLERAIMDGVKSLLVLEDDALPASDFPDRIDSFLASVPADWSQLMLGGQHTSPPTLVAPGIVRVKEAHRTHAYAVRGEFMRTLYRTWISTSGHCDQRMGPMQAHAKVYAPSPFLLGQAADHSDIACRDTPETFW